MIIQLVGLTGSGKTTAAPVIAQRQRSQVIAEPARPIRYLLFALYVLTHPQLMAAIVRAVVRETWPSGRLLLYKAQLLVGTLAKEQLAAFLREGVVDGGIAQYLYTIFEGPISTAELLPFKRYLRTGNQTIYLFDIEDENLLARLARRGRLPRAFMGEDYQARWLRVTMANHETIRAFLLAECDCMVVDGATVVTRPKPAGYQVARI